MMKFVWMVDFLAEDTPHTLSVHTTKALAEAARDAYIKSYRHGGTEDDYWVHGVSLNRTGLEDD
jgi:hypothetical protein